MMLATFVWSLATVAVLPGGKPWEFDESKVVNTSLTQIRTAPESFKGVWVRFPVQFSSVGNLQNPFFTRFVSSEYANFHVWADEAPIWKQEEFDNVFGLVFLSKENERLEELIRMDRYQRLELTAVVRNTFQGKPWIEIHDFTVLSGRLNSATIGHMYRGEQHMAQRNWVKAVSELSLAPVDGVPDHVQAAVHHNLGMCMLRMGEADKAVSHLQSASSLYDGRDFDTERLLEIAMNDPSSGLDRVIDNNDLDEADRPLWEAFAPARLPASPRN